MRKTMIGMALALGLLNLGAVQVPPALVERQETRAEQDLSAQVGMQIAAEEMARYTGWQVLLGFATTLGLLGTLAMTARSLRQTSDSLELAREELALARQGMVTQLRPYLSIEDFRKGNPGAQDEWLGKLKMKNFGQTPAVNVRVASWTVTVSGVPDNYTQAFPQDEPEAVDDVAPGASHALQCDLRPLPAEMKQALYDSQASIISASVVRYEDSFGNEYCFTYSEVRHGPGLNLNHFNPGFTHPSVPLT